MTAVKKKKKTKAKTKVKVEKRMSPHRVMISEEVLSKLVEARSIRQVPWLGCVDIYKELTGDDIDYRTLRDQVNESVNGYTVPDRVSKVRKEQIEAAYEDANIVVFIMNLITTRFTEFSIYHKRHLMWLINQTPDAEEPYPGVALTEAEMERMEHIYQDMMSFWWRCQDALRTMQGSTQSLSVLMGVVEAAVTGGDPSALAIENGLVPSTPRLPALSPKSAEAALETYKMLEELNERHKAEAIGFYRPLSNDDEREEGEDDDDSSI